MKNVPTVYFDTSVIGGCFDDEFSKWSIRLMEELKNGFFKGATSEIVAAEIQFAPKEVKIRYE